MGTFEFLRYFSIPSHPVITTPRLILRPWRDDDIAPFATLNSDPRVMEHFPAVRTRAETEEQVTRIREHFECHGFGYWALEAAGVAPFIGFVGLKWTQFEARFTPCVDIGWRLAFEHWGRGYATEAARAALEFGFDKLRLKEIVSFTVPANFRSRRVMERLGMKHSPAEDFDHPLVPEGHPLRRHVLYRLPQVDAASCRIASVSEALL